MPTSNKSAEPSEPSEPVVIRRYVYYTEAPADKAITARDKTMLVLVERYNEGTVVANITPLENVSLVAPAEQATLAMMRHGFVGDEWHQTRRGNQRRTRVTFGNTHPTMRKQDF